MAAGGPKPSSFYVERQALTRVPNPPVVLTGRDSRVSSGQIDPGVGNPTAGDGLMLANVFSITVSIYPNLNQTLSGAGKLQCYIYNPYQQMWTNCDDFDIDLSTTSNYFAFTKGSFRNASRLGMLINWATSAVTVSGGSDVLVRIDAFTSVDAQGAS